MRLQNIEYEGTRLRIFAHDRVLATAQDSLYYDDAVKPYLWIGRDAAYLAYAADPAAGSGQFASVWKIASGGRAVRQIGMLRYADLRAWRTGGVLREFRPPHYATEELERALPSVFDARYRDERFILRYRFDHRVGRFRFVGYHAVPWTYPWPETVRFPAR